MKALIIISLGWFISEIILARILRAPAGDENHDKSSLRIIWITIILSTTLGGYASKSAFSIFSSYTNMIYYMWLGLIVLGLIIRWIAILSLKKSFTVNVAVAADQKILKHGIYKNVRHPSYLGMLISFLGLAMIFNNWLSFLIIFFPIFMALLYRIYVEESALIEAFGGDYSEYMKHSKRLIPGIF